PLEQWRAQGRWPRSFDCFWEMLKQRRGKQGGTRAMIEALLLGRQYGYAALKEALEKGVSTLLCKRPGFVFWDGWAREGATSLPSPSDLEGLCTFMTPPSPRLASFPATES